MSTLKDFYELTKPGIIYGNAITAACAFLLASRGAPDLGRLLWTVLGLSLVVASGCVFNNYLDRDIDRVMERTKDRALAAGRIAASAALPYGAALGALGFAALFFGANALAALAAALGFVVYVFVYSLFVKRASMYGTHVGAIAGAMPPVVGYVAASGRLDLAALILFLILFFWQMPHFFAIALRRADDYRAAQVPALPLVRSARETRFQMLGYALAFVVACALLYLAGYAGAWYLATALVLGLAWMGFLLLGNARRAFLFSLVALLGVFAAMALNAR